jgi:hypothetical protein
VRRSGHRPAARQQAPPLTQHALNRCAKPLSAGIVRSIYNHHRAIIIIYTAGHGWCDVSHSDACSSWWQVQAADHNGRPPTGGGGKRPFTDAELEFQQRGIHEGLMKKWCAVWGCLNPKSSL